MPYGPYLLIVDAFEDKDLIYTEDETKQILRFFYPYWADDINKVEIENTLRAVAQTMMVAAIDGSYWMAYIDDTFQVIGGILKAGKNPGVLGLAKKLVKSAAKSWLKHEKIKRGLIQPEIYETVRLSVSSSSSLHTIVDQYLHARDTVKNDLKNGYRAYLHFS